ncbi:polysaccharide biosynthesis protein [Brevibacillus ginsengisoli]|uniref:polysaccharide biosynthesis protein n=1 Tax=Brevibacillus ginsengisoli TaxID=363854 RepID=UPI003CF80140
MNDRHRLIATVLLDAMLLSAAVLLGYAIRFEGEIPKPFWTTIPDTILLFGGCTILSFLMSKVYRFSWRFAGIREISLIIRASIVGLILTWGIYHVLRLAGLETIIPNSIFILSWLIASMGLGTSRLAWRLLHYSTVSFQPHHKRALIVGAGSAGKMLVDELIHTDETDIYPVAFLDDDTKKQNLHVMGVPIIGTRNDLIHIIASHQIDLIIIAIPSLDKLELANLIEQCKSARLQVKLLPRLRDLIEGKMTIGQIRDVQVEDLLGREPAEVNIQEISAYLTDKVVLVTGAGGSIGSELCRQISRLQPRMMLLLGHGENSIYAIENELRRNYPTLSIEPIIADIQDRVRIESVFAKYRPDIVFHAAAHKHVPLMEWNPVEAVKNNIFGTKNVAECAHKYHADRFVAISTDKAVNPTSVMGATKRMTELLIQSLDKESMTKFVAVRFGNVLGSRGSVIPLFKDQIKRGGPVTVTHPDMVRFFMTISEAVQLVIQAGAFARGGEIFILDMGKPVRIADLAHDLIRLSGLEPHIDIEIVYSGIRPGEKLYEEILTNEEGATASKHNRIFIGKPSDFSYEELAYVLRRLESIMQRNDTPQLHEEICSLLHHIVPTYQRTVEREFIKS